MPAVRRLTAADVGVLDALLDVFAAAFEDPEAYSSQRPGPTYRAEVLADPRTIVLVAEVDGAVVGGLVAYELRKLEQARSELYIYDLAVAAAHRRQGIARALIEELRRIAAEIGAWVVYVQADYGDDPAIALYTSLGTREDVMHFDIAPAEPG